MVDCKYNSVYIYPVYIHIGNFIDLTKQIYKRKKTKTKLSNNYKCYSNSNGLVPLKKTNYFLTIRNRFHMSSPLSNIMNYYYY